MRADASWGCTDMEMEKPVPAPSGWTYGVNGKPPPSMKLFGKMVLNYLIETTEAGGLDKDAVHIGVRPEGLILTAPGDRSRLCVRLRFPEGGFLIDFILNEGSTAYIRLTQLVIRFFNGPWFLTDIFRQIRWLAEELVSARAQSRQPNAVPTFRVLYDERDGRVRLLLGDLELHDEVLDAGVDAGVDPTACLVAELDRLLVPDPEIEARIEAPRDQFGLPVYRFKSFTAPDGRALCEVDSIEHAAMLLAFGATGEVATLISDLLEDAEEVELRLKRRVDSEVYGIRNLRRRRLNTGAALALPAPEAEAVAEVKAVVKAEAEPDVSETEDDDPDYDGSSDEEDEDEEDDADADADDEPEDAPASSSDVEDDTPEDEVEDEEDEEDAMASSSSGMTDEEEEDEEEDDILIG